VAGYGHEGQNTLGAFIYDVSLLGEETVQLTPLDDLVEREGITRVDVIKSDTEGAEFLALSGARRILARDHPLLLLELSDAALRNQASSSEAVVDLLRGYGYELFVFDPVSGQPRPGVTPPEQDPNVIAVHRHGCVGQFFHDATGIASV
jgi:hypothetical protein